MATRPDLDDDDDFRDIYKEYTGPLGSSAPSAQEKVQTNKRSNASSDEEEEYDPNAVPTDFTSREAKVWEAKSKATERNWKKRKEEEMICKICGESGHFTQGCPSTLGAKDFFERIAARDKRVRALFSDNKVIERIEKDIGCKIKMDEKFIIVSGKDRLILRKGVDAVHNVIKEGNEKSSPGSHARRSRSPERSPVGARLRRSESQRSNSSPRNASDLNQRLRKQDRSMEDRIREDLKKPSRNSPQERAYGNSGARAHSSHSRSPTRPAYAGNSSNTYDGHRQSMRSQKSDGWDSQRRGSSVHAGNKFERPLPHTLEELELEYKKEAMDLGRTRDKQEDEENLRHREATKELRETYLKKLAVLRDSQKREWEEFLRLDAQRQQQLAQQQMSASGFGAYQMPIYPDYDGPSGNMPYPGSNLPVDPRSQYSDLSDNYANSGPRDAYDVLPHQKFEAYGGAYNRY